MNFKCSVLDSIQGDTKKKNRLSPKIELLVKFYLDWQKSHNTWVILGVAVSVADIYNVSFPYYKKCLFNCGSEKVLQMSSPALQMHLDQAGKVLYDAPKVLSWNRSSGLLPSYLR